MEKNTNELAKLVAVRGWKEKKQEVRSECVSGESWSERKILCVVERKPLKKSVSEVIVGKKYLKEMKHSDNYN